MTRLSTAVNVLEEPPEGTSDLSPPPLESRAASPSISEDEGSAVQQDQTAFSQTDFEDNTHCRNLAELGNLIPDAGNIIQSYCHSSALASYHELADRLAGTLAALATHSRSTSFRAAEHNKRPTISTSHHLVVRPHRYTASTQPDR